jgi:hypothetical protein
LKLGVTGDVPAFLAKRGDGLTGQTLSLAPPVHAASLQPAAGPSPEGLKTLPFGKLPDRTDLIRYGADLVDRVKVWTAAVSVSNSPTSLLNGWRSSCEEILVAAAAAVTGDLGQAGLAGL